jgi:thiol-disulfide isomerase/thioredoxin
VILSRKFTKIIREILLYALAFYALSWGINLWRAPSLPDKRLPPLSGKTLEGRSVESLLQSNRPLLLHFWGTWCPICRQEASNLQKISRHYPLLAVAVRSGDNRQLRTWMERRHLSYPVLNDPEGKLARHFGISVYPTSLIYDARKKLRFAETGYSTTLGLLARMKWTELWKKPAQEPNHE